MHRLFNRTVWLVAFISLLTDISSEMLYPIMPFYLQSIGFSALLIGLLEGLAEALAGLSKGTFGQLSDARGARVAFVRLGYGLSSLSKPLLALSPAIAWVFGARLLDRLGKGIRTSPRDALLSAQATPETKGRVFGLHRGMDTLGAALGPVAALAWLAWRPGDYRTLFLLAFAPALLGVALTFLLRDPPAARPMVRPKVPLLGYLAYWKQASPAYRRLVGGLLAFTLCNSSDAFLLLRAREQGQPELWILGIYICYNLIYALASLPAGALADRFGMRRTLELGLLLFAAVYAGFAFGVNFIGLLTLFGLYALYAACSESIAKAWIAKITPAHETGTAIGLFVSLASLATLIASSLAGLLWQLGFPGLPFGVSALGALAVLGWFHFAAGQLPD